METSLPVALASILLHRFPGHFTIRQEAPASPVAPRRAHDSSQIKLQVETSVTLGPVATGTYCTLSMASSRATTSGEAILQFLLDALYRFTGLRLLMVNQTEHNLPYLTRDSAMETQLRADQKNAQLLRRHKGEFPDLSAWSDDEAPEEEMSDLSSDEGDNDTKSSIKVAATTSETHNPLFFDGLEFYLAVSQVRERTVSSVLALGMAKTLSTLRDQKQNESIAMIEQQYPDFTCLSASVKTAEVRQLGGTDHPPMNLLAALQLPSATVVAQLQSPMKESVRPLQQSRGHRPGL